MRPIKPKSLIDSTTQTNTWSLKTPPREISFEGEAIDVSNSEESMESESDFYCKSDTLNDASMITEEVASDFVPDIAPSDVKNEESSNKKKSSKSSRSKTQDRPVSLTEQKPNTNDFDARIFSSRLKAGIKSISSLKSIKLQAIGGTVTHSKSDELEQNDNNCSKSMSILLRESEDKASRSKSVDLEVSDNKDAISKSEALEINGNNVVSSRSVKSESSKSNVSHLENGKVDTIEVDGVPPDSLKAEATENGAAGPKPAIIEATEHNLTNLATDGVSLDNGNNLAPNHKSNSKNKVRNKARMNNFISCFAKKGSLLRCKTSLQDSIGDQPEENEHTYLHTEQAVAEEPQLTPMNELENGNNEEQPNANKSLKADILLTNNVAETTKERESNEILETLSNTDYSRIEREHSFESALASDNETSYCPKSSTEAVTDEESERSSIKENDNISLEYSSHWTAEYSSTEASEEEDEDFKERFRQYKKLLLEDDEGIAASCEDDISFVAERHMKEVPVMSGEDRYSVKMEARENSPSYDEETSYLMETETFEENPESFEQMSCSIDTHNGNAGSYEEANTGPAYYNRNQQLLCDNGESVMTTNEDFSVIVKQADKKPKTARNEVIPVNADDMQAYEYNTSYDQASLKRDESVNEYNVAPTGYEESAYMDIEENEVGRIPFQEVSFNESSERRDNYSVSCEETSNMNSDIRKASPQSEVPTEEALIENKTGELFAEVSPIRETVEVYKNSTESPKEEVSVGEITQNEDKEESNEEDMSINEFTEISREYVGLESDAEDTYVKANENDEDYCDEVLDNGVIDGIVDVLVGVIGLRDEDSASKIKITNASIVERTENDNEEPPEDSRQTSADKEAIEDIPDVCEKNVPFGKERDDKSVYSVDSKDNSVFPIEIEKNSEIADNINETEAPLKQDAKISEENAELNYDDKVEGGLSENEMQGNNLESHQDTNAEPDVAKTEIYLNDAEYCEEVSLNDGENNVESCEEKEDDVALEDLPKTVENDEDNATQRNFTLDQDVADTEHNEDEEIPPENEVDSESIRDDVETTAQNEDNIEEEKLNENSEENENSLINEDEETEKQVSALYEEIASIIVENATENEDMEASSATNEVIEVREVSYLTM